MTQNKQVVLGSRPKGTVGVANFEVVTSEVPQLQDGQVLVRNHFLSLDPYMRIFMDEQPALGPAHAVGAVMMGATVGEVVQSKSDAFKPGDRVRAQGGWQEFSAADAADLQKVDPAASVPLSSYLNAIGMPGATAWIGLHNICKIKAGETVVVSSAAGAVGSVAGQLAKIAGCRVIGIAGGPEKCKYVVETLGFDACVDYKQHVGVKALAAALREHAPDGFDVDFENVGGETLDAVMSCMKMFGRIAVCGLISGYQREEGHLPLRNAELILAKRLMLQGFAYFDQAAAIPEAESRLTQLVKDSKLTAREAVADGLDAAPEAFVAMLEGRSLGKALVKIC